MKDYNQKGTPTLRQGTCDEEIKYILSMQITVWTIYFKTWVVRLQCIDCKNIIAVEGNKYRRVKVWGEKGKIIFWLENYKICKFS